MKELSQTAQAVRASTTLAIDALFKQMKADGIDVIGFGAGEPDFNTPDNIKEAGIAAIRDNFTRYTPASGIIELRQAICARLKADCDLDYKPAQIVAASGAKHALYIALQTLVNPGDEIILPAPFWVSYYELIRMVGAVPVVLDATEASHFKLTAEQLSAAITPRTKALILNNPSNPTGMVYSREELQAIGRVCVEKDIYVIADEIYYHLIYDGKTFTSFPSVSEEVKERTILINGVSKSYAMTGWRIGFIAGPEWIVKASNKLQGQYTSGPCSVSQKAAEAAYTGTQAPVEEMRKAFERRRDLIVKLAKEVPGFEVNVPEGAFYLFPKCSSFFGKSAGDRKIENSDDLAMYLLEVAHVACVGGTSFGAPECIRMSYATSDENIVEAISRIKEALSKLV